MRLLRSTDLALRVLMRLAVAGDTSPTTRDVAAAMDVPYTHAAKVVAELQHMGLLTARRGRGGGLSLTEKGRAASVGGLVRAFEGRGTSSTATAPRVPRPAPCAPTAGCAARCGGPRRRSTPRWTR